MESEKIIDQVLKNINQKIRREYIWKICQPTSEQNIKNYANNIYNPDIIINNILYRKKYSFEQAEKNQKIVVQYFKHFNNHEWQKMAEMYIETAEFRAPTLGEGIVKMTRAEIIAKYSELNGIFTDIHDKVIKTYPSGDKNIIVEFVSSATAPRQFEI